MVEVVVVEVLVDVLVLVLVLGTTGGMICTSYQVQIQMGQNAEHVPGQCSYLGIFTVVV